MKLKQNGAIILIVVASLAVAVGVYRTGSRQTPAPTGAARRARANHAIEIDQRSLVTAEQLVHLPVLADERPFAEDAMRIADNEMDLAFRQAVRRTASQPRATSDTASRRTSESRIGVVFIVAPWIVPPCAAGARRPARSLPCGVVGGKRMKGPLRWLFLGSRAAGPDVT